MCILLELSFVFFCNNIHLLLPPPPPPKKKPLANSGEGLNLNFAKIPLKATMKLKFAINLMEDTSPNVVILIILRQYMSMYKSVII